MVLIDVRVAPARTIVRDLAVIIVCPYYLSFLFALFFDVKYICLWSVARFGIEFQRPTYFNSSTSLPPCTIYSSTTVPTASNCHRH
jgi:hypothetical protein